MMTDPALLVLTASDVTAVLDGAELDVVAAVRDAYTLHATADTALPHSTFLRFPDRPRDRIIALPAYVGGARPIAGMKWIASFPANIDHGLERASAVVALNSMQTGRPIAFLEGATISARRTAASAALAARALCQGEQPRVSLIGCGVIHLEIVRFLVALFPRLSTLQIYDLVPARGEQFRARCQMLWPHLDVNCAPNLPAALRGADLLSLATTALAPHIDSLDGCAPGCAVLHVSLRDLAPDLIARCDNLVDDIDHVCRAQTSVHLAEQATGTRSFLRTTLGDVLRGAAPARVGDGITVFSPFGLGILDIAVAQLVVDRARARGIGLPLPGFFTV
jgi:ornithine cyclodeaminase